jgi:hypothetical protein
VRVETGRDIAYTELWHRDDGAPRLPVAAVAVREANEHTAGAMLRVGAAFLFARDRAMVAAGRQTLGECVAEAPTLPPARPLLDCEISFGDALPGRFQITAPTLPYRIGDVLDPHFMRGQLITMDRAQNSTAMTRRWEITHGEGDPEALAAAPLECA